jgi:hypothetical protein
MNPKHYLKIALPLVLALLVFAVTADAQRGRYDRRHNNYNSSYRYYPSYRSYPSYGGGYYSSPRSYFSIGFGGINYRYSDGYYYRPYGSYYQRVRPPFGLSVSILPQGYSRIYWGQDPYYYYQGTFYVPSGHNGYSVAAPPVGATVYSIPPGSKLRVIDGEKYYEYDGTFYKEELNSNERSYTVAGTDGVLDTDHSQAEERNTNNGPARLDKLPADTRAVIISGKKYYLAPSGTYYEEMTEGNRTWYEPVGN